MTPDTDARPPRPPSLLDSLIPVVALIVLIGLALSLFGTDATSGPLQVALLLSAYVAALVARKNGHTFIHIADAIVGGVSSAMSAIFILLAVGALIGAWNLSGTTATVVYYGVKLLQPEIFYPSVALICFLVGIVTGSSWTTAGTLGVAFMGMAPVLGVQPEITAGAVISGAYLADKSSPLSDTTVLIPKLVGNVEVYDHIRAILWTTVPAFVIALAAFVLLALTEDVGAVPGQKDAALNAVDAAFSISFVNLLPLIVLLVFCILRFPPFLSILSSALFAAALAGFTQPDLVHSLADDADLGIVLATVKSMFISTATGFELNSGVQAIDDLFSRGGMSAMLTTIWLVLGALSFAAVMEHAGFLDRLIRPVIHTAKSAGQLICAAGATAIGLNVIAGDQYVSVVLPARMYRLEFARRGIDPRMLSRTMADTGTVTSALIPWNSCGAYMSGTLGVSTLSYFPYCFLNLLNPFFSMGYALAGFQLKRVPPLEEVDASEPEPALAPSAGSGT